MVAVVARGIFTYRQYRRRKLVRRHLLPEGTAYACVRRSGSGHAE
ncbi:hypothetical protein [Nocardia gipuzkoensis]